jgi:hypothetical protein
VITRDKVPSNHEELTRDKVPSNHEELTRDKVPSNHEELPEQANNLCRMRLPGAVPLKSLGKFYLFIFCHGGGKL